ncbi:MAG: DUF998 domain-containing protein [Nitrososphaerota archaeon]|nr:DUF998 domain-containing protein [Nitrososphaerota archaeon]MDG7026244.1 DUF998 domain-containing protein [Nitrososphaerota archaeon]
MSRRLRWGSPCTRAFPNAYISTDEPPGRSVAGRVLCALAAAGVGYLGLVVLALSLTATAYDPVTEYVGAYGVGAYAPLMNSGLFLAGVAMAALSIAAYSARRGRWGAAGPVLLLVSGVALALDGVFHADVAGAAPALHGAVHDFVGVAFFASASMGVLLVNRGWRAFLPMLLSLLAAFALAGLDVAVSLGVAGLAERAAMLAVFGSSLVTAVRLYGLA